MSRPHAGRFECRAAACARRGATALALLIAVTSSMSATFECLVEPWQVIEIRSPVEGLIEKVTVQRGDTIKKGQLLVELKSDAERSAVESARYRAQMAGRVASARHRVEYATKKLQRSVDLHAENFVAAQVRDDADAEKRLAESELQDAIENQELAKIEHRRATDLLNLRVLYSPINGIVMERVLNVGDIAEAGTGRKAILKIAQIDPLRVEVVLPAEVYGKLRVGMQASVAPEGFSSRRAARVTVIDKVFDAASGTFGARLELPNPGGALPGGLRCRVDFGQLGITEPALKATRGK